MHKPISVLTALLCFFFSGAQTPKTYTSSELLLQLKKLKVLGSVLYVAAHPDDENTRLLAYLASEKLYRTGYLSITRGDGGQNLIGDEQGVDLGLIRTQELLSARRIDGAEQFFTRAYDFGFSKSATEAMETWNHNKVLSDVVWVIRKFQPDVIITRFPEDSRAGHGHHAASGILAREAFEAAADAGQFPEQLKKGVSVWKAKRLLWNTFNFGGNNTQGEDQFKLEVGMYNPLLGKSYGEIASLSRSQHKSQGFGVAAQRGTATEYFSLVKGDMPVTGLLDGVEESWTRVGNNTLNAAITTLVREFAPEQPALSLNALAAIYRQVQALPAGYWKTQKLAELRQCMEAASGLFLDATAGSQFAVAGDSLRVTMVANNRFGLTLPPATAGVMDSLFQFESLPFNTNRAITRNFPVPTGTAYTQPYWLLQPMDKGSFNVDQQEQIGKAENDPLQVTFNVTIAGIPLTIQKPVRYKYTDPVRGELYEPVSILPAADLRFERDIYLFKEKDSLHVDLVVTPNSHLPGEVKVNTRLANAGPKNGGNTSFTFSNMEKYKPAVVQVDLPQRNGFSKNGTMQASVTGSQSAEPLSTTYKRIISYDHIPQIVYQKSATTKLVNADFKIAGKAIGYVPGAGDRVPQALSEMGYKVVTLTENDIKAGNLRQFDAIVTGVRAYNTNSWMNNVYDALMAYVKEGGVLLSQYNTSNQIGPIRANIAPYPFAISRNRVTDENAAVRFLLPNHPVLNYPNKITPGDFDGWIQERSIYNVDKADSNYQRILGMQDPGENEQDGSLVVANYGKGRFVYTGLVFFRELPAGVPGAYRLFANLVAATGKLKR